MAAGACVKTFLKQECSEFKKTFQKSENYNNNTRTKTVYEEITHLKNNSSDLSVNWTQQKCLGRHVKVEKVGIVPMMGSPDNSKFRFSDLQDTDTLDLHII